MRTLYRYLFQGLGILMVVGMITILVLAVISQNRSAARPPARSHAAHKDR